MWLYLLDLPERPSNSSQVGEDSSSGSNEPWQALKPPAPSASSGIARSARL